MDILISNLLSELIFDFGKWSNWKYANTRCIVVSGVFGCWMLCICMIFQKLWLLGKLLCAWSQLSFKSTVSLTETFLDWSYFSNTYSITSDSCSGKSGNLPNLINPAQANQANHSSLINPAEANMASLSAWSILIRQIRRSCKKRQFVRSKI